MAFFKDFLGNGKVTPKQAWPKAPEQVKPKEKDAKLTIVLLGEDQWISITRDFDTHPKESFKDFFAWYEDDDSKKTFSLVSTDAYYVVSKDKIKYAFAKEV